MGKERDEICIVSSLKEKHPRLGALQGGGFSLYSFYVTPGFDHNTRISDNFAETLRASGRRRIESILALYEGHCRAGAHINADRSHLDFVFYCGGSVHRILLMVVERRTARNYTRASSI